MPIEVSMIGSGEIGDITPGWNVQEFATPVTIGTLGGGTGSVSLTAKALNDSLFIVNNNITTTEDSLGSISGVVKTVSQTGISMSVTHDTLLSRFDSTFDIPPLGAGGMYPAIDLCTQLTGRYNFLKSGLSGHFYSMQGHSAGFGDNGSLAEAAVISGAYSELVGAVMTPFYYQEQIGTIWANDFAILNNKIWGTSITGDTFHHTLDFPQSRIMLKVLPNGQNVVFTMDVKQGTVSPDLQGFTVTVNPTTGTLVLDGMFMDTSTDKMNFFNYSLNLATLFTVDQELIICIDYLVASNGTDYTINVSACASSNTSIIGTITAPIVGLATIFNYPWTTTGNVRSIYREYAETGTSLPAISWDYDNPSNATPYLVNGGIVIDGPIPAQSKTNTWEYLQNACSAYGKEISIINDVITVRDIGTVVINIDNIVGSPTVTPSMIFSGRSVEIGYSNAYTSKSQELYNAENDNNRIISVDASETITTTVPVSGTPTVLVQPTWGTGLINNIGEYKIICSNTNISTGVAVPLASWTKYGGRVEVSLSTTAPNSIDITLYGPTSTDGIFNDTVNGAGVVTAKALYTAPYKLAYTDSITETAALSIIGSGIRTNPKTLKLATAADPLKVSQDVAKTINNPFITTIDQAYERGIWSSIDTSGPSVTLSGVISTSELSAFGLVAGALISYRDSIYRIVDATIGNLSISFNAKRHVDVSDFDAVWASKPTGRHDRSWYAHDSSDHVIAPLRYEWDIAGMNLSFDADSNPYYGADTRDFSILLDTDDNPYYVSGGDAVGAKPVYLDTDTVPYLEA